MSLTPEYIPTHGTLADRVVEWMSAHHGYTLTREDIALKFDVPRSRVPVELARAVMDGRLAFLSGHPHGFYVLGSEQSADAEDASPPPAPAIAAGDLVFSISPDRCIAVSFTAPGSVDPRMVLAAMLTAAATTIGKQP